MFNFKNALSKLILAAPLACPDLSYAEPPQSPKAIATSVEVLLADLDHDEYGVRKYAFEQLSTKKDWSIGEFKALLNTALNGPLHQATEAKYLLHSLPHDEVILKIATLISTGFEINETNISEFQDILTYVANCEIGEHKLGATTTILGFPIPPISDPAKTFEGKVRNEISNVKNARDALKVFEHLNKTEEISAEIRDYRDRASLKKMVKVINHGQVVGWLTPDEF